MPLEMTLGTLGATSSLSSSGGPSGSSSSVPFLAVAGRGSGGLGWLARLERRRDRGRDVRRSPATASPSASTGSSPTSRSSPTGPSRSRWRSPASMAIQGPVIRWVADHRKHHKFSDRDGDPHSPWRYGDTVRAL